VAEHLHADERIRVFIYGHTHELETGWALNVEGGAEVRVHNTGAFQRTIHEEEFIDRMKAKNVKPSEALRAIKLEDLPPCYSALLVTYESGAPKSKTWRWHMPEDGTGTLVEPDSPLCQ
jgi:hypothetical protein